MTLSLYILAALLYGGAVFAYGAEPAGDRKGPHPVARSILIASAVAHLASIGSQCVDGDHPLKSVFLASSLGALLAVAGYFPLSRGGRLDSLGALVASVGLVGLSIGVLFSGEGVDRLPGTRPLATAHVALASAGLAGFTLAAGVSGLYLVTERRLRTKQFRPGGGGMSLIGLDRLQHRMVLFLTPVLTLAIVTGVIWILQMDDRDQVLQGRAFELVAAGIAWVASAGLVVSRAVWGTRGRRSAWLTLIAFAAIVGTVASYGVRA